MLDPLHQFEIHKIFGCTIGGMDLSFTNASLWMVIVTASICLFLHFSSRNKKLIPDKSQSFSEFLFNFINKMVNEQIGKEGMKYFPYFFSLFIFILFANLIGLLPYTFTVTSHIIVTFTLAMLVFLGMTIVGLIKHRLRFFKTFLPSGLPWYIAPLLVPVEVVSYLVKPISLSIRLFANMVAGHIMMKIIAGAAVACAVDSLVPLSILPVGINAVLTVFELFVAALQAYIFTLLSCIYLNSVLHMH
jgi:F-type H+-transporting ATPase subunit a